jgi:hypothetical protein
LTLSSWAAAGRDDNDLFYWEEVPKEKTPEGPNGGSDPDDGGDSDNGDYPFGMHLLCCAACCHSISDLYASAEECFQAMEVMRQRMEDLERVVEDDYKFLEREEAIQDGRQLEEKVVQGLWEVPLES